MWKRTSRLVLIIAVAPIWARNSASLLRSTSQTASVQTPLVNTGDGSQHRRDDNDHDQRRDDGKDDRTISNNSHDNGSAAAGLLRVETKVDGETETAYEERAAQVATAHGDAQATRYRDARTVHQDGQVS
jgi:hypothetical protein